MVQVARLSADLVANTSSFESGLSRANRAMQASKASWNSALSQAGRNFSGFSSHVDGSVGSIISLKSQLGGFVAATASAFSVTKITEYADSYKMLEGRLKLATNSADQFASVQRELFAVAQSTSTPLSANIEAYARLSQSLTDAQKKNYDLVAITKTLSQTLAISGTSGQMAGELIRQFGQAASSDFKAVGQEIGSIADQAPRLYKLLSDAFAGSGKSLKQLAADGELSTAKVLDAIRAAAPQIAREAESMGDTVGKAFTKLDNAFLTFIGKSALVNNGTSSIAAAISGLADNFDTVAVAVGAVAAVMAGKFVTSLLASAELMAVNATGALALNVAIGRLAFGSTAAAVGMTALSGVTTALSGALALVGGPVGAAVLATFASIYIHSKKIKEAQAALNAEVSGFKNAAQDYINASADMRKKIEGDINARIAAYRSEATQLAILANQMEGQGTIARFLREAGNVVGLTTNTGEVRDRALALGDAAKQLEALRAGLGKAATSPAADSIAETQKQKKAIDDLIVSLKSEADEQSIRAAMAGRNEAAVNRAVKAQQIQNDLAKQGVKITDETKKSIDAYLDSIEKNTDAVSRYNQAKQQSEQLDKARQDIFRGLQDETREIQAQVDAYGQKAATVSRAVKEQEIANQLAAAGIHLTKEQAAQLDEQLDKYEQLTDLQKRQQEQQKRAEEQDRNRKRAMDELGASFKSSFEDAIVNGEKFGDVLNSLFKDIERLLLRINITEPLVNAITSGGGGNILSSIGDFIFGGIPSHATGIDYVPRDMMARIHKGEAVIPAREAAAMRSGGGSGEVTVNIINNAGAKVGTSSSQGPNGTDLTVMIDQAVASNISRPGSQTNQALAALRSRTLTKR